jgi:hypothetical protein
MKLMLSCPSLDGRVTCLHKTSAALTGIACIQAGIGFQTSDVVGCGIIDAARSIQIAKFMASDCTHILMVDGDIAWEPATALGLLVSGRDFAGAAYPQRGSDGLSLFCIRTLENMGMADYYPRLGLLRVEAIGTGFMLVSRNAVVRMIAGYPELKIDDLSCSRAERPWLYELFKESYALDPSLEFGGRRRDGEDYSFCLRWRALGGEVFVDPHAEMLHGNATATTRGRLWDVIKDDVEAAIGAAA